MTVNSVWPELSYKYYDDYRSSGIHPRRGTSLAYIEYPTQTLLDSLGQHAGALRPRAQDD
jgi:hypothetical protein